MDFKEFQRRKKEGTLPDLSRIQCSAPMTITDFMAWGAAAYGLLIIFGGR